MKMVEGGPAGVWSVDNDNNVWKMEGKGWKKTKGLMNWVSVGVKHIWCISKQNTIYVGKTEEGVWEKIPGNLSQVIKNSNHRLKALLQSFR